MPDEKTETMDFAVDVTEKEYVRAVLFASRRIGALRSAPFILAVGLLLLTVGLCAFSWFPSSLLLPVFLCVSGPLLVLLFYLAEPAAVRRSARAGLCHLCADDEGQPDSAGARSGARPPPPA